MGDAMFYSWFLPAIPVAAVAILVLFVIGLVIEGRQGSRAKGLRQAFTYSVALLSLGITVVSAIFLVNLGLRATVLPKADTQRMFDSPPSLYFEVKDTKTYLPETAACADKCDLSDADKAAFQSWKDSYTKWQSSRGNTSSRNQRDAVNGSSFLIVGLALFIYFFRMVQRDAKGAEAPGPLRSFYFYGFSLVGLVMLVISGILLINLGLKTWVFPKAGEDVSSYSMPVPAGMNVSGPELAPYQSVKNCASKCGFSDADVALVDQWIKDTNSLRQTGFTQTSSKQRDLATELPVFAAGLGLFLYHFLSIRRQGNGHSSLPTDHPQTA